jgi:hypothetical protein
MNPRTPAEALRRMAWETYAHGAVFDDYARQWANQGDFEQAARLLARAFAYQGVADNAVHDAARLDALPVVELSEEAKQAFTLKIQARSDASLFFRQHCVLTWDDVERALDAAGFAIVEVPRD